jgi:methyl-accepting chemotaxis protein
MSQEFSIWRSTNLRLKLTLVNLALISCVLGALLSAVGYVFFSVIEQRLLTETTDSAKLVQGLVSASDRDLRVRTSQLAKSFKTELDAGVEAGTTQVDINGVMTPSLLLNGTQLNLNFNIVDRFTGTTGAVATIFARSGEDFIRISTSLKNEKGNRAIGTKLDRAHPGYAAVVAGTSYTGLATLFGRRYMTKYDPIVDSKGKVIGLSFVGVDFSDFLVSLKDAIRALKVGKNGNYFIINSKEGKGQGEYVVHPSSEGKDATAEKDATGVEYIKKMIATGDGSIKISTKIAGSDTTALIAYTHYKDWNWIIAGQADLEESLSSTKSNLILFGVMGIIAIMVVCVIKALMITAIISKPLGELVKIAQTLATGDLRASLKVDRSDEIGKLMVAMNSIGAGLSSVVSSVRSGSENVASASSQIAQGNQDLSERTESQAAALEQTAAAMKELGITVSRNAQNSKSASTLATDASNIVLRGGAAVAQVVGTMKEINESSKKISEIISVIDGIAFQTNILALNAAVEAARAGEQGRGFAVVASEVRSLAGRSADAAKEIGRLINTSVMRVEQGSAQADSAGETMTEVVSSISKVTSIVSEISEASAAQSRGVLEVIEAVQQMDSATQQNATLVEEMAAAAKSLSDQSDGLVSSVSVFRLP